MDALAPHAQILPAWGLFALFAAALWGTAVALPRLRRRLLGRGTDDRTAAGALEGLKFVFTALVFVLAVSLNQVMTHQRQVEEAVGREASLLDQLDRQMLRAGVPGLPELRPRLHAYLRLAIAEEWPAMAAGGGSGRTQAAASELRREIGAAAAAVSTPRALAGAVEVNRTLEQLAEARDRRLASANLALPGLFWAVLALVLALAVPLCAMTAENLATALLKLGAFGSVALLAGLVAVIDRPFLGETRVTPAALERALERMEARAP